MTAIVVPTEAMDDALLLACCHLWAVVWPKDGLSAEDQACQRRAQWQAAGELLRAHRAHVLRDGDRVVAVARTFVRRVTIAGAPRDVLALASVCSAPDRRGEGLGVTVVRSAFGDLNAAVPVCLFQTGVPGFYERLGSRQIANPIANGLDDRRAFWDPYAMIHPGTAPWPDGPIDVCGPGW